MVPNDFPQQLPPLLTRVAEDIPPDVDLWPAVRERLAAKPRVRFTADLAPARRGLRTAAALLVALAVLVVGVAWFHQTATQSATVAGQIVHINRTVQVDGVTLTVHDAFADATRTIVTFSTPFDAMLTSEKAYVVEILDAHQHIYHSADSGGGGSNQTGVNAYHAIFAPLPTAALGHRQTLTFRVAQIFVASPPTPGPSGSHGPTQIINGPWDLQFQITPIAGKTILLTLPPSTRHGITVQPVQVDWMAPDASAAQFDGNNDIARLELRLSGLPAKALLNNFVYSGTNYQSKFDNPPAGVTLPQVTPTPLPGKGGGGTNQPMTIITLTLPDGEHLVPAFGEPLDPMFSTDPTVVDTNTQTIGPNGTLDLEYSFLGPRTPHGGTATFTIGQLQFDFAQGVNITSQVIAGPWTFTIPLG